MWPGLLLLALAAPRLPAEVPSPKVYAHYVPWHPPTHARPDRTADAAAGVPGQVRAAARAGLDGLAVDIVLSPPTRSLPGLLDMARTAAEQTPGFGIMPCLDLAAVTDRAQWEAFLRAWIEQSEGLASVARVEGRYLVFTYAAYQMPLAEWRALRESLARGGREVFLVADIYAPLLHSHATFAPQLPDYAAVFDALYCFGPVEATVAGEITAALAAERRATGRDCLYVQSVRPGYYGVNTGSFSDVYRGAGRYLETWQAARDLAPDWASVTTWNDYTENTHIEPSRMFSDVYARLTRDQAALFRGRPEGDAGAETYWLAAPSEISDGPGRGPLEADARRESRFQVLGLAAGGLSATAVLRLTRPDGTEVLTETLGLERSGNLAQGTLAWEPEEALNVRCLWAEASVFTAHGAPVTARLPVPVWPRDVAHRFYMPPRWARLSAGAPPKPEVGLRGGRLDVSPLPAQDGYRTDVLHDLYPKLDPHSNTAQVAEGLTQLPNPPLPWGFYEAAVVTPDAGVSWAAPLWVAPEGDPLMLALWRFNDALALGADDSIYARHARIVAQGDAIGRLADGGGALRAGPEAWAQPPGSFLPIAHPITVELWVRPTGPGGGMVWGDVGAALLITLNEANVPRAMRHLKEGDRWVTAK
ncbi:MAG: hypothetical protein FJX74_20035, partial [Armatimonadetes bacterium]|nr:hypothetical protein [Armatimonadota bacterium]